MNSYLVLHNPHPDPNAKEVILVYLLPHSVLIDVAPIVLLPVVATMATAMAAASISGLLRFIHQVVSVPVILLPPLVPAKDPAGHSAQAAAEAVPEPPPPAALAAQPAAALLPLAVGAVGAVKAMGARPVKAGPPSEHVDEVRGVVGALAEDDAHGVPEKFRMI